MSTIFPTSIEFKKSCDGLFVKYKNDTKYEIDIWSIAYLLYPENKCSLSNPLIDISLPKYYPEQKYLSLALRLYFLSNILNEITIKINGTNSYIDLVKTVIQKINNGEYITYNNDEMGSKLEKRGTKSEKESKIEEDLKNNKLWGRMVLPPKRQWPANIFESKIKACNRRTRKRWIDMVGIDTKYRLSAIEIKAGTNLPLDLFVQNFDYMVYLHLFKKHIINNFFNRKFYQRTIEQPVCGYFVAEKLHPLLENHVLKCLKDTDKFVFIFLHYDSSTLQKGANLIELGNHSII